MACALDASVAVYGEQIGLEAIEGRREAARVLLPSNPVIAGTLGDRLVQAGALEPPGVTWSATLSQELEIAGQRGTRLDVVAAEERGQRARVQAVAREVASAALVAYFDALAAREEKRLADRLLDLSRALGTVAVARAEIGVGSTIEADIADAAATRLGQAQVDAERRVQTTTAVIVTLLGRDPTRETVAVDGDLVPLLVRDDRADALAQLALSRRADVRVAEAEREAEERRVDVLRRARVPNVTLSVFAQRDTFDELVIGGGLSLPIPLPSPVGRTRAGEIAEAEARTKRSATDVERVRRAVLLDVSTAFAELAARRREAELYSAERVARAERALAAIARELEARRIGVRETLVAQQSLIEELQAAIRARRQLCLASVDLARAAGTLIDQGGAP